MTLTIAVQQRAAVHYVGRRLSARLAEFGTPDGPNETIPKLYQWLAEQRLTPVAGPLYIYHRIGDPGEPVDMTVAVPLAQPVAPGAGLIQGTLPAGRYLVGRHVGHPDQLTNSEREMLEWAREHQITPAVENRADEEIWAARAEHFLTDPQLEPDATKWVVELLLLTR